MKKTVKKILCVVLVAAICAAFAGCAKMNYVTNATIGAINEIKAGTWNQTKEEEKAANNYNNSRFIGCFGCRNRGHDFCRCTQKEQQRSE